MATQVTIKKNNINIDKFFNTSEDVSRYVNDIITSVENVTIETKKDTACLFAVSYHKSSALKDIADLNK